MGGLGMISRGTLSVASRHKWRMSWAGLSITTLSGLGHLRGILDRFEHSDIELAWGIIWAGLVRMPLSMWAFI